jgi:hypothetical protein
VIEVARRAQAVMRQNLALAIGYNVPMVRLAGWVTPWLAVAAMSCSLVLVITTVRSIDQQFQWVGLYCLAVSAAQFQNSSSHPEFFKCCARQDAFQCVDPDRVSNRAPVTIGLIRR